MAFDLVVVPLAHHCFHTFSDTKGMFLETWLRLETVFSSQTPHV